MGLWVAFLFGGAVGAFLGFLLGRQRQPAPPLPPPPPPRAPQPDVRPLALDAGSANVLNALNNRLAGITALAELLAGGGPEAERERAYATLGGEVRRAGELTRQFLELARPTGGVEPADVGLTLAGVLGEREVPLRELGVRLVRNVPDSLALVSCPLPQLHDMLGRLLDFALRRLREGPPPRELRIDAADAGASVTIAVWDSGPPLAVEAEQRLVSPFRFTKGGGGEIEFALARVAAHAAGGSVRLRARAGGAGAEVVATLPKTTIGSAARRTGMPIRPLRVLVAEDDAVNRDTLSRLLQRAGHTVTAVADGSAALEHLGARPQAFDAVVTDLQMPGLSGQALWERLQRDQPALARRFVFVTGDHARDETRTFLEQCGQPAVLKPYDVGDLLGALARVGGAA